MRDPNGAVTRGAVAVMAFALLWSVGNAAAQEGRIGLVVEAEDQGTP